MLASGVGLEELRAHERATAALCAALDPDSIALHQATTAYASVAHMVRLLSGAKTRLARKVDEAGAWKRRGARNAAEFLAKESGTSEGEARGELDASRAVAELAGTDDALRQGELSATQARLVAQGVAADPGAERTLLDTAKRGNLRELRDEVARAKVRADGGTEETQRRLGRERFLRTWRDVEGGFNLLGRANLEDGAAFLDLLQPMRDELFRRHQGSGDRHNPDAYGWDALLELMRRGAGRAPADPKSAADKPTPPPKRVSPTHLALLRVDLDALVRGATADDETCDIAGIGPVPVSVARRVLGDAVLKLVVTKGVDVLNVTNLGRGPNAAQKIALLWRSPRCIVEDCTRPATQHDHRTPWPEVLRTDVGNIDPYCGHHHYLKTYHDWGLLPGTGRREMVPPDDPRHPANAPPTEGGTDPPTEDGSDPPSAEPDDPTLFGSDVA